MEKIINVRKYLGLNMLLILLTFQIHAQDGFDSINQLTDKQQKLISIGALTANGNLQALNSYLNKGLDSGLTINQIKEAIVHSYAYCGFPRSIRGLQTFMEVLKDRKAKGIHDVIGKEASPINDDRSKYDRGKDILGELTGTPQDGTRTGYAEFAPEIEIFLKEHLFADIFERDVLTYIERELVTISVISSIGKAEPMLRSHMNICLNLGITKEQLQHFISTIETTLGANEANATQKVLDEVLAANK